MSLELRPNSESADPGTANPESLPVEVPPTPRRLVRRSSSAVPATRSYPGSPARAFDSGSRMPALRQVGTPRVARKVGVGLILVFIAMPFVMLLVPWRQSVYGDGQVIGFHPLDREFMVESPIYGRVKRFYVNEGDHVQAGDPIATVENIDTQYLETLRSQLELARQQRELAELSVESYKLALGQAETTKEQLVLEADSAIEGAREKVNETQNKIEETQFDVSGYKILYEQTKALYERGLEAGQSVLKAEQIYRTSEQKLEQAKAALEQAEQSQAGYEAKRKSIEAKALADVEKARTEVQNAQAKIQTYSDKVQEIQIKIRQQEQGGRVLAPRDGTVLRLLTNIGAGAQVKDGDPLAILIPDTAQLATELYLPGRDIPLVRAGDPVRLQFEGWPALQFIGWPAVAVGTFPARVALVDSTQTKAGKFRVLVVPDMDGPELEYEFRAGGRFASGSTINGLKSGASGTIVSVSPSEEDDPEAGRLTLTNITGEFRPDEPIEDSKGVRAVVKSPWPSQEFLRQGARANGWVLLREVPLGFEIWRRLNGFAPVVAQDEASAKDGAGGGKDDKPKVKRPK